MGHLLKTSISCFSEIISVERTIAKRLSTSCRIINELLHRYSKCKSSVFDRLLNCCILGSQSKIAEYDH